MSLIEEFSIPNLDAEDESEMAAVEGAAGWLTTYAMNRKSAIRFRSVGRILEALALEEAAEEAFRHLPDSWKW